MTCPRTCPGQSPQWAYVLETSNGRSAMTYPDEERPRRRVGLLRQEPDYLAGVLVLGAVVLSPAGEVVEQWGREFDPSGPALFLGVHGCHREFLCLGCARTFLTGSLWSPVARLCAECVYARDPEPRPRRVDPPPYREPRLMRTGRHTGKQKGRKR